MSTRWIAALLVLAMQARAQFVVPEGKDFHNGSTLPLEADGQTESLLVQFEQALAVGDPDQVAHALASLRARQEPGLSRFGARTHLPAVEKALRLVRALGSPELVARVEAGAAEAVASALADRDVEALLALSAREAVLPAGRAAALHAARLLFEQGRWWPAACLAERVTDVPGASELAAAARARLPPPAAPPPAPALWELAAIPQWALDPAEGVGLPLVLDGRPGEVLVLDSALLLGMRLHDGVPVRSFPGVYWRGSVLGMERFQVSNPAPREHTAVRAGDRLVLPFNVSTDRSYRAPPANRDARLLALDLGDPPTLAWMTRVEPREPSAALGPPTLAGDRLFCQVFRTGRETEVSLACFDLVSGALLFDVPLVRGTAVRRFASRQALLDVEELDKRAREGQVAVAPDGTVYACTGFGALAAVDGVTGRVRHLFRYDRLFPLEKDLYDASYLFDTGGWNHEPVRLWGDRVVVAPSDSRFLYVLALEPGPAGHLILDDPLERLDRVDVVALRPDPQGRPSPAIVATRLRDGLTSLVLLGPDGHVLERGPALPDGERQRGRPAVAGSLALLPTDRGVRTFDLDDLQRPPGLLAIPADLPPARSVAVLHEGLVALCPDEEAELLHIVLWRGGR